MQTPTQNPNLFVWLSPKVILNLTLGATVGMLFSLRPQVVQAQLTNPNNDGFQTNEVDPLYGSNGSFNPLELLHRANLGGGNAAVFNETLDENLNDASQDFRRQQLELLRQQQVNTVETVEEDIEETVTP